MNLRPSRIDTRTRGFVLVIVLVVAAAAVAIGAGMIQSSGLTSAGAAHAVSGDRAADVAQSGLSRALGYLDAVVATTQADYDLVLDPDLVADCTTLPAAGTLSGGETGNMNVPKFTDGSVVTLPAPWSKRFSRVALDGGAYFVRFDDDNDDFLPTALIPNPAAMESNHVDGAAACNEGVSAPLNGVDNPARDRNGQMWVTVIGIHPGTDIATASHRSVVRKLVQNPNAGPAAAAFSVGGDIDARNFEACSEIGGLAAGGDIIGGVCACNSATSGTATNSATDCGAACPACAAPPANVFTGIAPPPPAVPNADDASWFDWKSPCNFYMDPGATGGFYFWDHTQVYSGNLCSDYAGNLPLPDTNVANVGSCWVPIAKFAAGAVSDPMAFGEVAIAGAIGDWRPTNAAATYGAGGYFTAARGGTSNKPAWGVCPLAAATASDFGWVPPAATRVRCSTTGDCNGATTVIHMDLGAGASTLFQFENTNPKAYPTGVYFHEGAFTMPNNCCFAGARPASQAAAGWPMITLINRGTFTVDNPNKSLWLGVGTKKGGYPSLVVEGDWNGGPSNIDFGLAGGLYVKGNFDLKNKGISLYGPVMITGDMTVGPGAPSDVMWDYSADLLGLGTGTISPPPRMTMIMGL